MRVDEGARAVPGCKPEYAMHRLNFRAAELSMMAAETSFASAITIAARAPILLGPQDAKAQAETPRMVAEKVEASIEGFVAAQVAFATFWAGAFFGAVREPADFAHGFADIATAATAPMSRRARANAKRLVKPTR
jgi:hypothetical protein